MGWVPIKPPGMQPNQYWANQRMVGVHLSILGGVLGVGLVLILMISLFGLPF